MHTYGEVGELHNQALASYGWGTYHITLSRASAYAEQRYLGQALASLSNGVGAWRNGGEFRALVSLLHETAHYQQDISTGIGHWDYITRKKFRDQALDSYRSFTWIRGPEFLAEGRAHLSALGKSSVFNVYPQRADDASQSIRSTFQDLDNYNQGEELLWTVPRLLELDAVMSAWASVKSLGMSEEAKLISKAFENIFNPFKMPEEYSETFLACLRAFVSMNGLDAESSRDNLGEVLDFFQMVLPIFLDISMAYPPPSYFGADEAKRSHFEPGIRLVRIVRQAQRAEKFMADGENDILAAVDEATRHTEEFEYPPVGQVYTDWVKFIDDRGEDDPVLSWRKEMCQRRVAGPSHFVARQFGGFVQHDLPLFVDLPGDRVYMYMTRRLMIDGGSDLFWTLQALDRDFSLIDLFLGTGKKHFKCPMADVCKVAEAKCRKIPDLTALPGSEECTTRSGLLRAGFNLESMPEKEV